MTPLTADAKAAGGIERERCGGGGGSHPDNNLMAFRFKFAALPMQAAEAGLRRRPAGKFRAGAFIIANADRARLEPALKDLGLSG